MPGAILFCKVVATRGFSSHICIAKKVNKQAEGNSSIATPGLTRARALVITTEALVI